MQISAALLAFVKAVKHKPGHTEYNMHTHEKESWVLELCGAVMAMRLRLFEFKTQHHQTATAGVFFWAKH